MNRLNYFASYSRQAPHWENQITRAFLVVLRHVPLARAIFVEVIRELQVKEGHSSESVVPSYLSSLGESIEIETQVKRIESPPEGRLTSVLLTDQGEVITDPVRAADREAVYDGVFAYGDQVLVIENKPNGSSGARQINPARPEGERYGLNPRAVVIVWRELLAALSKPLLRGDVSGAEALILGDFLDYVQENAPQLYPYSSIAICGDNIALLNNRLRQVMEQMAPGAVRYHLGYGHYIRLVEAAASMVGIKAYTHEDGAVIVIELHPGDSQRQARHLYRGVNIDQLQRLTQPIPTRASWEIRRNFHYAYRASNICYPDQGNLTIDEYVRFWSAHLERIAQVRREADNFESAYQFLLSNDVISHAGLDQLRREVSSRKYDKLNVCPGLSLFHRMPLAEAAQHDNSEDGLANRLTEIVSEAMSAWGQNFVPIAPGE